MLKQAAFLMLLALLGAAGWLGNRWLTAVPPDPLRLAQARMEALDVPGAQALARQVARDEPRSVAAHLMLARISTVLADWASVEREARTLRTLGYDRLIVTPMLAQAYLMQGLPQSVLSEVPTVATRPEEQAVNLAMRSRAYVDLNEPAQARANLDAAVQLAPGNSAVLLQQARMALAPVGGGKPELGLAMAKVDEALRDRPDSLQGLLLKAQVLDGTGDLAGAVRELDVALRLTPASPLLHLARAELLMRLRQDQAAQADVDAALTVAPHDDEASYLHAVLQLRGHHLAQGTAEMEKLGAMLERHPEAYMLRAQAAVEMGNTQAALDNLDRLLRFQPNNAEALRLAARLSLQVEQPSRAVGLLKELLQGGTDDAEAQDLLGRAYFQLGQTDEAIRSYGKAVAKMPDNAGYAAHLAAAKAQFGAAPLPPTVGTGEKKAGEKGLGEARPSSD